MVIFTCSSEMESSWRLLAVEISNTGSVIDFHAKQALEETRVTIATLHLIFCNG